MSKLRRFIIDFFTVRMLAKREISHVVKVGKYHIFDPGKDSRNFANAYCRLPEWARKAATWGAKL